jgi:hypothetical protein
MDEEYSESSKVSLWPIAIFEVRYGGTYEFGAKWFAVAECESAPVEALGDDSECLDWFITNRDHIGLGANPNEALSDLYGKKLG